MKKILSTLLVVPFILAFKSQFKYGCGSTTCTFQFVIPEGALIVVSVTETVLTTGVRPRLYFHRQATRLELSDAFHRAALFRTAMSTPNSRRHNPIRNHAPLRA
ncbi:unnamed protein product [Heligmosomoides polygyrus]|uniref:Secreted protein n=1 Tax=Heligmosomoides polygyrus TaxID=6339 RepID=A0A183GT31_HELPZ|nr:unnamed protein product [Heligmosomoides polygyrus]